MLLTNTEKIILNCTNKERVRMDEDTDLKSAGLKGFGGSIPFFSANLEYEELT